MGWSGGAADLPPLGGDGGQAREGCDGTLPPRPVHPAATFSHSAFSPSVATSPACAARSPWVRRGGRAIGLAAIEMSISATSPLLLSCTTTASRTSAACLP